MRKLLSTKTVWYLLFGLAAGVMAVVLAILCYVVILFHQFLPLFPFAPNLLGIDRPKNYLILFQNNMELRPGGGFIGSFATVTADHGRFGKLQVHNTYDADGQLKQHVEPYFIGRRYIQVHLYMRDSNFDVDFAKSAQKVAELYQLETGHKADGVVAIDFSYVQSLVALLSPIHLWQYNETITGDNVFLQTEYHADRYSFSGSTQKQDFLHALFEDLRDKFFESKLVYSFGILQKTVQAVQQKHILFESADSRIQNVLTKNNLSSTLYDARPSKADTINDFLGINEANIGVNKSNYFLKRSINHHVNITSSGWIQENLQIIYTNTTQSEHWPTGRYIAYVRLILPHNAKLTSITIDGKKQDIVPAVTDARVYEAPGFKAPAGLEVDRHEEEGKTIYGLTVLVSYHTTKIVDVSYQLEQKVTSQTKKYNLVLFKQPGMVNDPLQFMLSYPKSYKLIDTNFPLTKKTNSSITFLTTFLTDKDFIVSFSQ